MDKKIRTLTADEIECRVARVTEKGSQWLLYKDVRCDKRILDEVFGPMNWKNSYREIKGNLYCTISIWDEEKQQWIDKEDCGTESNTEKEKGEASDAFKRACVGVGIGRELYTRIFIWIGNDKLPVKKTKNTDRNGDPVYKLDGFPQVRVSKVEVDEATQKIISLEIVDEHQSQLFTYPKSTNYTKPVEGGKESQEKASQQPDEAPKTLSKINQVKIRAMYEGVAKKLKVETVKIKQDLDAALYTNRKKYLKDINDDDIDFVLGILDKWAGLGNEE